MISEAYGRNQVPNISGERAAGHRRSRNGAVRLRQADAEVTATKVKGPEVLSSTFAPAQNHYALQL
jgi:hypothetical protein